MTVIKCYIFQLTQNINIEEKNGKSIEVWPNIYIVIIEEKNRKLRKAIGANCTEDWNKIQFYSLSRKLKGE